MKNFAMMILTLIITGLAVSCSPSVDPYDLEKLQGPRKVLATVFNMDLVGDYTGIEDLVYGINYAPGKNSGEDIIDGIKRKKKTGDFAFSRQSFQYIVDEAYFRIIPILQDHLNQYFLESSGVFFTDSYLKMVASTEPHKIHFYNEGLAVLIFVEIDGKWKLLFSKEVTNINPSKES